MITRSQEYREKQRIAQTGKKRSEETKVKIREARKRQIITNETKRKIGNSVRGVKNGFYGKHHSNESIEKIILANKGRKLSAETRLKMSLAGKGKKKSNEWKKKVSGKNSVMWKGGITPLGVKIRGSFKYRQWRSDCFTRDNFICVLCDQHGGELQVDHYPKSFSSILRKYEIKTLEEALNCEELWNINNGRTLCVDCHKRTDTYLKNKNNAN